MDSFAYTMFELIETLTSNGISNDKVTANVEDRQFNAPYHVQDLMYFGQIAGKAAERLRGGDLTAIDCTQSECAGLSSLAAIASTRRTLWVNVEALMKKIASEIITTLHTPKLIAHWKGSNEEYVTSIICAAYNATRPIIETIPMNVIMAGMLHNIDAGDDLQAISKHIMSYVDSLGPQQVVKQANTYRDIARDIAIETILQEKGVSKTWKKIAAQTLGSRDNTPPRSTTKEEERVVEITLGLFDQDTYLSEVARFAAWMTAIYRYTEFGPKITAHFIGTPDRELSEGQNDELAA